MSPVPGGASKDRWGQYLPSPRASPRAAQRGCTTCLPSPTAPHVPTLSVCFSDTMGSSGWPPTWRPSCGQYWAVVWSFEKAPQRPPYRDKDSPAAGQWAFWGPER